MYASGERCVTTAEGLERKCSPPSATFQPSDVCMYTDIYIYRERYIYIYIYIVYIYTYMNVCYNETNNNNNNTRNTIVMPQ